MHIVHFSAMEGDENFPHSCAGLEAALLHRCAGCSFRTSAFAIDPRQALPLLLLAFSSGLISGDITWICHSVKGVCKLSSKQAVESTL
jgi:hypothetical protein